MDGGDIGCHQVRRKVRRREPAGLDRVTGQGTRRGAGLALEDDADEVHGLTVGVSVDLLGRFAVDAEQSDELDALPGLLLEFTASARLDRLAELHASTGQAPGPVVGAPHEQNPTVRDDGDAGGRLHALAHVGRTLVSRLAGAPTTSVQAPDLTRGPPSRPGSPAVKPALPGIPYHGGQPPASVLPPGTEGGAASTVTMAQRPCVVRAGCRRPPADSTRSRPCRAAVDARRAGVGPNSRNGTDEPPTCRAPLVEAPRSSGTLRGLRAGRSGGERMAARRSAWLAVAVATLAVCAGMPPSTATVPTSPGRAHRVSTPWGPVAPPPSLVPVAAAYYDGAGPVPQSEEDSRPACLLLLPTSVAGTGLQRVPTSQFNVFGQFVVRWRLTGGGTGLTLLVYGPGDPSDRDFFAATALVSPLPGGAELRTAPQQPRSVLIRIPNENCEYELQPGARLPTSADGPLISSLRLVFEP